MEQDREILDVDVLFVGGGAACLSGAIHLADISAKCGLGDISIAVLEKGSYAGAHIISGAVMDPSVLAELIPDFEEKGAPIEGVVKKEQVLFLTRSGKIRFPIVPPPMDNHGSLVVSISKVTEWLAQIAEEKGVDIFTGFAATDILYHQGRVMGVTTGDKGIGADGRPKASFEPGIDLRAKVTVFGEGARGSLTKKLIQELHLDEGRNPQNYVVGIKEVWETANVMIQPGEVVHTMGFPHKNRTYGGGFIYGMDDSRISIGLLTGLDYGDPWLDPHREFQKFKTHPFVASLLKDGKILQYGANTAPVGGYFAIPQLYFDGGVLVGDCAGLFISQKLKGIHVAMKSGMLAAETICEALLKGDFCADRLKPYQETLYASEAGRALYKSRNFHQLFRKGLYGALLTAGIQYLLGGRIIKPRLLTQPDHSHMRPVAAGNGASASTDEHAGSLRYDGVTTFDKETDVYYSGTSHEESQPPHLKIVDLSVCYDQCLEKFQAPCQRFCPANVYEIRTDAETGKPAMRLNFSNCLHCKTCDVKDPYQNIVWVPPEGGDGPKYTIL